MQNLFMDLFINPDVAPASYCTYSGLPIPCYGCDGDCITNCLEACAESCSSGSGPCTFCDSKCGQKCSSGCSDTCKGGLTSLIK